MSAPPTPTESLCGARLSQLEARAEPRVREVERFLATPLAELIELHAAGIARERARHFQDRVQLFTPLYLSSACMNDCSYCGFRRSADVRRRKLTLAAAVREARAIAEGGHRSIDLVTGEVPRDVFIEYVERVVELIRERTPIERIHLNLGALGPEQYRRLRAAGASGYHLYQETYDPRVYSAVHGAGPKRDMEHRLRSASDACDAGFERIGLGILLGLAPLARELATLAEHARALREAAPQVRVGFSLPRIQRADPECDFRAAVPIDDETFLKALLYLRTAFPDAHLTLTTRESAALRDAALPLGITKLSAGVSTAPGGYTDECDDDVAPQFSIHDQRSLTEVAAAVRAAGLEPVFS